MLEAVFLLLKYKERRLSKEARSGRVLRDFSGAVNMDIRGEFSSGREKYSKRGRLVIRGWLVIFYLEWSIIHLFKTGW